MELISSLLLYAVVALLPQAFGRSSIKVTYNSGFNDSVIIKKRPFMGKNIFLNIHSPPTLIKVSDLQSVFMDPMCRGCFTCMERSIKAHRVHNQNNGVINVENYQNELSMQDRNKRDKRKVHIDKAASKHEKKVKKSKSKKNNKAVTIIKYNDNDKVYALKIKETYSQIMEQNNRSKSISSCEVYSVQKSSVCESQEADLILAPPKKKITKKDKKEQSKVLTNVSEVKATVIAPTFRKRLIDNSQVPEHIMPSVEEMY